MRVFPWSSLIVQPSPVFRIARNFTCGRSDCVPRDCTHRHGFHVVILGLVVIVG